MLLNVSAGLRDSRAKPAHDLNWATWRLLRLATEPLAVADGNIGSVGMIAPSSSSSSVASAVPAASAAAKAAAAFLAFLAAASLFSSLSAEMISFLMKFR